MHNHICGIAGHCLHCYTYGYSKLILVRRAYVLKIRLPEGGVMSYLVVDGTAL
jgi:hypothetical protein